MIYIYIMLCENEKITSYEIETGFYDMHNSAVGVAATEDLSKELILNCCY